MRALILICLMLAACSKEPTFEEKFDKQTAEIERHAIELEHELDEQIKLVPEATEVPNGEAPAKKADE